MIIRSLSDAGKMHLWRARPVCDFFVRQKLGAKLTCHRNANRVLFAG